MVNFLRNNWRDILIWAAIIIVAPFCVLLARAGW